MEANPKYIRNVMNVLGLEEAKPVITPSVKRTPTTESLVGASRRHVQREGNSKKNYMSNRERRDEFEAYCEIPERRSECKEPDRNHYTSEVREHVHREQWETQHSQHGHEHSKQ